MTRLNRATKEAIDKKISGGSVIEWLRYHDFPSNPLVVPSLFHPRARMMFLRPKYMNYASLITELKTQLKCDSNTMDAILIIGAVEYNARQWLSNNPLVTRLISSGALSTKMLVKISAITNNTSFRTQIAGLISLKDIAVVTRYDPLLLEVQPLMKSILKKIDEVIYDLPLLFLEKHLGITYDIIFLLCSHPRRDELPPKLANCVALLTEDYNLLAPYSYNEDSSLKMAALLSHIPKPPEKVILHLSKCVKLSYEWVPHLTQPFQLTNMAINCKMPSAPMLLKIVRDKKVNTEVRCAAVTAYSRHYSLSAVFDSGRLDRMRLPQEVKDHIRQLW